MKTAFLILLFAGIGLIGCSTAEQSQTATDSTVVDTVSGTPNKMDSTETDTVKSETMPAKRDSM